MHNTSSLRRQLTLGRGIIESEMLTKGIDFLNPLFTLCMLILLRIVYV